MSIIDDVAGREILDSRGNPTVEVEVELIIGRPGPGRGPERRQHRRARGGRAPRRRAALRRQGRAGRRRARERRDPRRGRSGSTRPTSACSTPTLCALDGTDAKGRLGANAILGVSLAAAKAVADECGMPLYRYVGGANAHVLPVPMMNVLNGGAHADNNVDLQEFMIVPVGAVSFAEGAALGRRDVPRAEGVC